MAKYPNLEAERARAGMTKQAMCRAVGITMSTYTLWQTGKNEPTLKRCKKVAEVFGQPIEYLFNEGG